ncbi:TetR family transcriptional regulator [Tamaricihabitans halophyticus]|uniref:TetR family transcriptional regulator n=1 Tax=Tamaricihabitans halophyticus TaxID=1262583 RepID=A0A4R2QF11_9PSEU|nr:TetR/AcrR family transcriptional regulator [Tamaricihabitans halophyticus]TCP47249.1 TetR family transcriptional regulator [Tamaricihabitans halophyticus]
MRPSSKQTILAAARKLAERSGIRSLTLDAAAREAGLSKGGLIYHFASKEQLMLAVVAHLAADCEEAMLVELGKPFEAASAAERVAAYGRVIAGESASRGDLAILIDSVQEDELLEPWRALLRNWLSESDTRAPMPDARSVDLAVSRLAADGLWLATASSTGDYDETMRAAIRARIGELAAGVEGDA